GLDAAEPWEGAATVAQGLRVPSPLGDRLVLQAIRETGGAAVGGDDALILEARGRPAAATGGLGPPQGAAPRAGAQAPRVRGDLGADDTVVLVNAGSGLVDAQE